MEDNSWSQIILNDMYNTFYKDEVEVDEEIDVAKESEDMALSIMKEKFLSMVEYEKEKAKLMVSDDHDEIDDVILEDLQIKYRKDDKGKEKVDDLQNRVERLEWDLARAEKGKTKVMVYEKGKAKADALDDVDLVDAFDLENRIKKLSEDFNRLLKAKKAKEAKEANEAEDARLNVKKEVVEVCSDEEDSSDEGFFCDEDVVMFIDVKYPLSDVEIRMFKERPTTSRAPPLPQDSELPLLPQDPELPLLLQDPELPLLSQDLELPLHPFPINELLPLL
ncbi:hypothetical protein Tco_1523821 [Tanacetum coccineum]